MHTFTFRTRFDLKKLLKNVFKCFQWIQQPRIDLGTTWFVIKQREK